MYKRIRQLSDRIIAESFPRLQGKRVIILVAPFRFYALSLWVPPFFRVIIISTRVKSMSDFVITGILAHELCHQERYLMMGPAGYLRFAAGYLFSNKARTLEERATDYLAIEKGYARELHELTLISRADPNHETIIDNYLTPEEIIIHAKKSGKWD